MILQLDGLEGQATYSYADLNMNAVGEFTKQSIVENINNVDMPTVYVAFFMSIVIYMFLIYLFQIFLVLLIHFVLFLYLNHKFPLVYL